MKRTDLAQNRAEERLAAVAAAGNLDAFNELVLHVQDRVYRHACYMVGDADLAEDVTQESFIKAFHGLGGFRGGSFRAWILRIVTHESFDTLRRSKRRPAFPLVPHDGEGEEFESPYWLADPTASVQEAVEQKEESERLEQMLQALPAASRMVITLVDLYDFDYQEAAQTLGIPVGTLKSRLARARMQMRKKLKTRNGNDVLLDIRPVAAPC